MASMRGLHTSVGRQATASLTRCECENARKRAMCHSSYSPALDLSDYDVGEEDESGDCLHFVGEKKKRLKYSQVKRLEQSFEVANRLEPETKIRLAKELGLHPRQIAVWFQNRRARCKTKQVEKDFDALKQQYDALKQQYDVEEQGSCSCLSTNSLDLIGDPNDLLYIEAIAPEKSFNFEIAPMQNAADTVLQPNDFPMESFLKPKVCKNCAEPVGDIYATAINELDGGYCSIISEAAISIFDSESTPSPRFSQIIGAAADFSTDFSRVTVGHGSSIGEEIAGDLETSPPTVESHCIQETLPEVAVDKIASLFEAEETCHSLFDSLNEQDALMLWDY